MRFDIKTIMVAEQALVALSGVIFILSILCLIGKYFQNLRNDVFNAYFRSVL